MGEADTSGNAASDAFLYSSGSMHDLGTLGGTECQAYGINDSGVVVGWSTLSGNLTEHAFIYSNGITQDLNNLIPPGSGWVLHSATGINDVGQIVGSGNNGAFLLNPIVTPEPSTFALLGVGAISLTAYSWRRRRQAA